jgi:stage II sporulation protein D
VKARYAILACWLAFGTAAQGQALRVRIDSVLPPAHMEIIAADGALNWKTCAMCPEHASTVLSVDATPLGLHIASVGKVQELFVSGSYKLDPSSGPSFSGKSPLQIAARNERLLIVAAVPLEDYIAAVVAAESGDSQQGEAMKAMAVAARTYALKFRQAHQAEGFDFCDSTHCQAVRWTAVSDRVRAAVAATGGQTLTYRGELASAYYHQNCGGTIAAASEVWPNAREPYLREHSDPYCASAGGLKWESGIAVEDLDRALLTAGLTAPHSWTGLEITSRTPSGRAQRLRFIGGSPDNLRISASSFRFAIDRALGWGKIRSDLYDIRNSGGKVLFSGRGSGHGVGMCQAGEEEMAREGKSYTEILIFYYPGTQLTATREESWQMRRSQHFELMSAHPEADSSVLAIAERTLRENEDSIGWRIPFPMRLQIFSTIDAYRDTTGEPGWVAASTRGHVIRLEPLEELQSRSVLQGTLRHEIFHLLVEMRAESNMPLWFREGVVVYLASPNLPDLRTPVLSLQRIEGILQRPPSRADMEKAYAAARNRVAELVNQRGKDTVLNWLTHGIPPNVASGGNGLAAPANQ